MSDKEFKPEEIVNDTAALVFKMLDERKAAEKAEADAKAELEAKIRADVIAEIEANKPDYKSVSYQKVAKPGEDEASRKDAWLYWARTGDDTFLKKLGLEADDSDLPSAKAMQEGTTTEGGFLVPDDWYTDVIERRNRMSWVRQACSIYNTSRDNLSFAVENAASARFTLTAEEASYNDTDRAIAQAQANIYKFTRLTKVSEELLADDAMDLGGLLASQFARDEALTEMYYVANGTGSSQPQGILGGGGTSDAYTDTGLVISVAGVMGLYGALSGPYRANGSWLAHDGTMIEIRKLRDTNNWAFGDMYMSIDADGGERLLNKPFYTEENIGRASTAGDSLIFGDFSFYAFVERAGLVVTRNPYLYEASGQVGFFARKRFGGVVTQAEAFQILKTAS